jgi:hypothetical protein
VGGSVRAVGEQQAEQYSAEDTKISHGAGNEWFRPQRHRVPEDFFDHRDTESQRIFSTTETQNHRGFFSTTETHRVLIEHTDNQVRKML